MTTNDSNDLPETFEDRLARLQKAKNDFEAAEKAYDDAKDEILPQLTEPSFFVGTDGVKYKAVKVTGSIPRYNEARMKDVLKPEQIEAITDVKINGTKLKAEVAAGRIDALDMGKFVTFDDKKPYPKFDAVE